MSDIMEHKCLNCGTEMIVLVETPACEDSTAYLMDRKDVEKWKLGGI